jgi:hypothetical protein
MSRIRKILEEVNKSKVLKEAVNEQSFLKACSEFTSGYEEIIKIADDMEKHIKLLSKGSDLSFAINMQHVTINDLMWEKAFEIYDSKKTPEEKKKFADAFDRATPDLEFTFMEMYEEEQDSL